MDANSERIPTEIKFFSVGLAGGDYVTEKNWTMKTLKSIFEDNNHINVGLLLGYSYWGKSINMVLV